MREGQKAEAGDVLVRLDDTATRPNYDIVLNELAGQMQRALRDD